MTATDREGPASTGAPPASRLSGLSSPFEASVVISPWNPAAIDVPEINGHVAAGFLAPVDALDGYSLDQGAHLFGSALEGLRQGQ